MVNYSSHIYQCFQFTEIYDFSLAANLFSNRVSNLSQKLKLSNLIMKLFQQEHRPRPGLNMFGISSVRGTADSTKFGLGYQQIRDG